MIESQEQPLHSQRPTVWTHSAALKLHPQIQLAPTLHAAVAMSACISSLMPKNLSYALFLTCGKVREGQRTPARWQVAPSLEGETPTRFGHCNSPSDSGIHGCGHLSPEGRIAAPSGAPEPAVVPVRVRDRTPAREG